MNDMRLSAQSRSASQAVAKKHELKVSGLSWATNEAFLRELFEDTGNITAITIPKDSVSGHCRGFAFVAFTTPDSVQRAIEQFNAQEVDGMRLSVTPAQKRDSAAQYGVVYERSKAEAFKQGKARREKQQTKRQTPY